MSKIILPPKPEVLAPAGSKEKLITALRYGADAVYMAGTQFGLRAFASNFTREDMHYAVDYVHSQGKKVYITANIYAHQEDLPELPEYFEFLESIGVDAIIISDPGVFALARKYAPNTEKHISTQASTTNAEACNLWYELGARRIVLARELTLREIAEIRRQIPADMALEAFVHGAMCMAYSGRCILSNHLTGRDANRGKCSQPCRWKYRITDAAHDDKPLDLEQDDRGTYILSSNDLCMIDYIPELVQAGINSLKIEGRMKGAYYAAIVSKAYREAVDKYYQDPENYRTDPEAYEELCAMVHRTYATGFYFDKPIEKAQIFSEATYMKEAVVLAVVKKTLADGRILCEQRNKIILGDQVQAIRPQGARIDFKVELLTDVEGNPIDAMPHPKQEFIMNSPQVLPEGAFIRRMGDKDNDPDSIANNLPCVGCE